MTTMELDIPGALERLEPYGLNPIERVLVGHTGTVQLFLSLLFGEPVDVVLVNQEELEGVIQRVVRLRLRDREVEACRAFSLIDTQRNAPAVLQDIRDGKLGLGQIAVKFRVPIQRTVTDIRANYWTIVREYTMETDETFTGSRALPPRSTPPPALHYVIYEGFHRELFKGFGSVGTE